MMNSTIRATMSATSLQIAGLKRSGLTVRSMRVRGRVRKEKGTFFSGDFGRFGRLWSKSCVWRNLHAKELCVLDEV
jgi:hypothetical protein